MRAFLMAGLFLLAAGPAAGEKVFRYGMADLPVSRGNPYTMYQPSGTMIWSAIFDALTVLGERGAIEPALATSWEMETPTQWRFNLRRGVTFSNDELFDADAVVATFAWLATPAGRTTQVGAEFANVAGVDAVDSGTVAFRLTRPDAIFPRRVSIAAIVAPRAWSRLGPEGFADAPAGTGAFQAAHWPRDGGRAELVAHRDAWQPPRLDRVAVVRSADSNARLQALLSGQLDLIESLPFDDIETVTARGLKITSSPVSQVMALALISHQRPDSPLADARVRRALNHAIDRAAISAALTAGLTRPAGQGATPLLSGYNPEVTPYTYDPAKARMLLADAGYPNGFEMAAEIVGGGFMSGDVAIYTRAVADLAAVGVKAELRTTTLASYTERMLAGRFEGVDAFGLSWNGAPYNDALSGIIRYSCRSPSVFHCDPAIEPLIEAADTAPDMATRDQHLRALAATMHDAAPSIFLVEQADVVGHVANLINVRRRNRNLIFDQLDFTAAR
ncbi:MAG: ABC transporter substrate-binding protein [Alphaproteobacteria bacterium]|nr:ABC transporter substrate-binding protein [Alphaproteobacteria bacterium]